MNPQNGSQKSFVNLSSASDQKIIASTCAAAGTTLTLNETATNSAPSTTTTLTNVKLVSQYTAPPGSINLTITNGSVNLRPAGHHHPTPGGGGMVMKSSDNNLPRPTLLRANISGSGALHRLPIQNLVTGGSHHQPINLKLNPIMRFTGTTGRACGSGGINQLVHTSTTSAATTPQGILRPVTLRPLNASGSVVQPSLVSPVGHPITLRPVVTCSNQPIAPMPIMQAMPQNIAAQLIPHHHHQASTTALLHQTSGGVGSGGTAKITTSMPIGQLQYMPGGQMGKLQMRALTTAQPIKIRPAVTGGELQQQPPPKVITTPLTTVTMMTPVSSVNINSGDMAASNQQPMNLVASKDTAVVLKPSVLQSSSTTLIGTTSKASSKEEKQRSSSNSKDGKAKAKRKDSVKTKLASKEAPFIKEDSREGIVSADKQSQDQKEGTGSFSGKPVESSGESTATTTSNKEAMTSSNMTSAAPSVEEKKSCKTSECEGEEEDGLVWKDGIGTLQGSDIRFRKNEFGLLEMITEEQEETNMEEEEEKVICCCENCGIHGLAQEFLSGGRFCSRRCVGIHASKKGQALRKGGGSSSQDTKGNQQDGPVKRKKRKLVPPPYDHKSTTVQVPPTKVKVEEAVEGAAIGTEPPTKSEGHSGTAKLTRFSWQEYLDQEDAVAAPDHLFTKYQNPTHGVENGFHLGMRLEGIDPKHPALYCVMSVAEVRGYRLRLHYDGYSDCYDFWSNADAPFLFPAGWSLKHGKLLQPPKNYTYKTFSWPDYLRTHKYVAAPESCFHYNVDKPGCSVPRGFQVGQKLEAVDKKNSSQVCVASIADLLEDHVLIHFDGWEDVYDYWCDPSSPYIHAVGWCEENQVPLSPPKDWKDVSTFTWEEYLEMEKSQPVPATSFTVRPITGFEIGHRLEAVDKRNQILVRAATVADVESHSVVIHFCGWSDAYDYTVDADSTELHPCGWCEHTGHPLCPPLTTKDFLEKVDGCPTPGCTGVGHIKGAKFIGHHSAFGCPYSNVNMNKETSLHDRMGPSRPDFENGYKKAKIPEPSPPEKRENNVFESAPERPLVNGQEEALSQVKAAPKPLFGKGSGRGRKKTIVRLMHEAEQARQAQAMVQNMEEQGDSLQQEVHSSVFTPSQIPSPYRDLPLGWEQNHVGLLPGLGGYKLDEVCDWDPKQVAKLISQLPGCSDIAESFLEEQIDGESLLLLNQADMVRVLNMKLGPALKIYNAILMLKNNSD